MSDDARSITLNTGSKMPLVGLGTYLSKKGEVGAAVETALKAGYRHVDCAACYENEKEIGPVFSKVFTDSGSGVARQDVFITSKLWITDFQPDKVRPALVKTLADLQLEYLDLYLMHIPTAAEMKDGNCVATRRSGHSLLDTWRELELAFKDGLVKAIGVSNFPAVVVNDFQNAAEVVPAVNQIERHPYLAQTKTVAFNKELGIALTAYAPLGAPGGVDWKDGKKVRDLPAPLHHPDIVAIAAKHKKTASQVLIRWSMQCGVTVIPKSVTPSRIIENFDVFDFELDASDMASIDAMDCHFRTFTQEWMGVPCFL